MAEPKLTIKSELEEIEVPINPAASVNVVATTHAQPVTARIIDTASLTWHDPVAEKLKELEERIDKWQNKFEFINVGKK